MRNSKLTINSTRTTSSAVNGVESPSINYNEAIKKATAKAGYTPKIRPKLCQIGKGVNQMNSK
jgi:hypothetical protein